jgi:hypothetical protein
MTGLAAQKISYNQEFKVTDAKHGGPCLTCLSGGGFIVVWQNDEAGDNIFAQIFDRQANQIGTEFQVNSTSEYGVMNPSICSLANGGFVVCWEQSIVGENNISAQVFDNKGQKTGSELTVEFGGSHPSTCGLTNGGFVISWNSNESYPKLIAQIFDHSGDKIGPEIEVDSNPEFTIYYYYPSVCGLTGGGFVINWQAWTGVSTGIFAQIFDNSGDKISPEFQVNSDSETGFSPSICGLMSGGFVVSWEISAGIYSNNRIMTQLFDNSGNKIGSEFQANETSPYIHIISSAICSLTNGGFVICWTTWDETSTGLIAQIFDNDGYKIGWDFQVNSLTGSGGLKPSLSGQEDDGFVIGWYYSGNGIYGKYYVPPINHLFIPFSLLEPEYDSSLETTSITFKWSPASKIRINLPWEIEYKLYLDETDEFNNPRVIVPIYDTTRNVDSLLPGKTYFWKVQASNINGESLWSSETFGFFIGYTTSVDEEQGANPSVFELFQNYPNPFNPTTTIRYQISQSGHVEIRIYGIDGKIIQKLVNKHLPSGKYSVIWDASGTTSGIYFYQLIHNRDIKDTKRLILVK